MKEINKQGFTLVELLVVIAIVGLLSSVVLVGLGPVRAKGRDARRLADIKQTAVALELYAQKCGRYPGNSACAAATPNFTALKTALIGAGVGVKTIANDPLNTGTNVYEYASCGTGYVLAAKLEDNTNKELDNDVDGADVCGIDCGAGGAGTDTKFCTQL